ncbi:MAG: lytic transglycosylase domain-containing protein [bacterium]
MDFLKHSVDPGQWGVIRMMERIEQLESRFKSMIPMPPAVNGDFQNQLKQSLESLQEPAGGTEDYVKPPFYDELLKTGAGWKEKGAAIDELIGSAAGKNGLSEELINAVVKAESNFNPGAVSPKGAMGLMQLMPGTAAKYGVSDPFDPGQNLEAGSKHLRMLLDRYGGDLELALAAYNAGEGAVETYKGVPPYEETQAYVARVMDMLGGLR